MPAVGGPAVSSVWVTVKGTILPILLRLSTWKSPSLLRGSSEKTVREVHSRSGGVFQ